MVKVHNFCHNLHVRRWKNKRLTAFILSCSHKVPANRVSQIECDMRWWGLKSTNFWTWVGGHVEQVEDTQAQQGFMKFHKVWVATWPPSSFLLIGEPRRKGELVCGKHLFRLPLKAEGEGLPWGRDLAPTLPPELHGILPTFSSFQLSPPSLVHWAPVLLFHECLPLQKGYFTCHFGSLRCSLKVIIAYPLPTCLHFCLIWRSKCKVYPLIVFQIYIVVTWQVGYAKPGVMLMLIRSTGSSGSQRCPLQRWSKQLQGG